MGNEPELPPTSRNISDAALELRGKWALIQKRFHDLTGNDLILTCTHRTVAEQQRLYAQGRTTKGQIVTWVDGVTKKSNHNYYPSKAIDVAVVIGGKVSWDPKDYQSLGIICKDLNLKWGGSFKPPKIDLPHIELISSDGGIV